MRERKILAEVNKVLDDIESTIYQIDKKYTESGKYLNEQIISQVIKERIGSGNIGFQPIAYMYQQVDEYLKGLNRK